MLTADVAHKAVFTNVPISGFKNDKVSKITMFELLPKVEAEGISKPCVCVGGERSCEVCKSVDNTSHFKRRNTNQTFGIQKGLLDCNSNHVIYVSECKQCQYRFPFVGRTKSKFKYRINNYKSIGKCRKKYV